MILKRPSKNFFYRLEFVSKSTFDEIYVELKKECLIIAPNLKTSYRLIRNLGEGSQGSVGLFSSLASGKKVAIKRIEFTSDAQYRQILKEIQALRTLSHCENIIGVEKVYIDEKTVSLVMTFAPDGTLFDVLNDTETAFEEKKVKKIMAQLLLALNFMHRNKLLHRDIKPANILVLDRQKLQISIADLGLTHFKEEKMVKIYGTPGYIAPEVFCNQQLNFQTDVFSAGVIFFNLISGKNLFEGESSEETYMLNKKQDPILILAKTKLNCSPVCLSLLEKMLHRDPKVRLSSEECLKHKWFENS